MRRSIPVMACVALALFALPAFAGDIIKMKSGRWQPAQAKVQGDVPATGDYANSSWTVLSEGLTEVKYRIAKVPQPQTLKTEDIEQIFHDPQSMPAGLVRGDSMMAASSYDQARQQYTTALNDKSEWAKARAALGVAESFYAQGDSANAASAFQAFVTDFPDSMFMPRARQRLALALLAAGKVEEAKAAFQALIKMDGISADAKLAAEYYLVWIDEQIASGDAAELKHVRNAYITLRQKMASSRAGDAVTLKSLCVVRIAACDNALGSPDEARSEMTKLIKSEKDPVVLAGAYTMLGNALRLANTQSHDKAQYKEALFAFLRVVCMYGTSEGAEEYMAESLYRAGEMFWELRPTDDKVAKREFTLRAYREWRECQNRFPGTIWAGRAARGGR